MKTVAKRRRGQNRPAAAATPGSWWKTPEAMVVACILISFFILWPIGQYAVDDEWAFLKSLEHWAKEGRLVILQWNPMSLVGHILWGGLFTGLFGFSFNAARISALMMFIGLGLSVAGLLRELKVGDRTATLALLSLVFAPLCFFHGFLYVTDIPACTWTCTALLLLLKGLKSESRRSGWSLLAGSACGCVGFLVRQSGALIFLTLFIYLLVFDRHKFKTAWGILAVFVFPAITIAAFQYWYLHVHGATVLYRHEREQILHAVTHPQPLQLALYGFKYGIYVGLFCLPLLAGIPVSSWRRLLGQRQDGPGPATPSPGSAPFRRGKGGPLSPACAVPGPGNAASRRIRFLIAAFAALCCSAAAFLYVRYHLLFPYLPNKLTPFGFLSPNEVIAGDRPVLWGKTIAWAITILLTLALITFVAAGFAREQQGVSEGDKAPGRLLTVLTGAQFVYLLGTAPIVFDRHLLMLLPSVLLLLATWTRGLRLSLIRSGTAIGVYAAYSLCASHDVHAFSRAAFEAGQMLAGRGIGVMRMDCGYAYDGWNTFERWQKERIPRARPSDPWWIRALMQGTETRFVASLSTSVDESAYRDSLRPWSMPAPVLQGYQVVAALPYRTWWPPGSRTLYVLGRSQLPP